MKNKKHVAYTHIKLRLRRDEIFPKVTGRHYMNEITLT
jgi:hypothetical protein